MMAVAASGRGQAAEGASALYSLVALGAREASAWHQVRSDGMVAAAATVCQSQPARIKHRKGS